MSIEPLRWEPVTPAVTWSGLPLTRHAINGATMGTRYSAVFTAPIGTDRAAIATALQAAVDRVDNEMSNWEPASDLSRFNAGGIDEWIDVPMGLAQVVAAGLAIGRQSEGTFDIGVGDAVDAWGFGAARSMPDAAAIDGLAQRPQGSGALEIDMTRNRLRRTAPVQLDLCGIAKGFGVDELARCLEAFGIGDYLVAIDGDMRAAGTRLDGQPWQVAIERPDRTRRDAAAVIGITNRAIATSGDYRHWREIGGRTISHTIDPRTRQPVDNGLASVSVMADDCMTADAWATALLVAGEVDGPRLAEAMRLDAFFIVRAGDDFGELAVGRFG